MEGAAEGGGGGGGARVDVDGCEGDEAILATPLSTAAAFAAASFSSAAAAFSFSNVAFVFLGFLGVVAPDASPSAVAAAFPFLPFGSFFAGVSPSAASRFFPRGLAVLTGAGAAASTGFCSTGAPPGTLIDERWLPAVEPELRRRAYSSAAAAAAAVAAWDGCW